MITMMKLAGTAPYYGWVIGSDDQEELKRLRQIPELERLIKNNNMTYKEAIDALRTCQKHGFEVKSG